MLMNSRESWKSLQWAPQVKRVSQPHIPLRLRSPVGRARRGHRQVRRARAVCAAHRGSGARLWAETAQDSRQQVMLWHKAGAPPSREHIRRVVAEGNGRTCGLANLSKHVLVAEMLLPEQCAVHVVGVKTT